MYARAARGERHGVQRLARFGLVIAGVFVRDRVLMERMRAIAFTMLTPFYFLKAGLYVSLPAVASGALLIAAFFCVKILSKVIGTALAQS